MSGISVIDRKSKDLIVREQWKRKFCAWFFGEQQRPTLVTDGNSSAKIRSHFSPSVYTYNFPSGQNFVLGEVQVDDKQSNLIKIPTFENKVWSVSSVVGSKDHFLDEHHCDDISLPKFPFYDKISRDAAHLCAVEELNLNGCAMCKNNKSFGEHALNSTKKNLLEIKSEVVEHRTMENKFHAAHSRERMGTIDGSRFEPMAQTSSKQESNFLSSSNRISFFGRTHSKMDIVRRLVAKRVILGGKASVLIFAYLCRHSNFYLASLFFHAYHY